LRVQAEPRELTESLKHQTSEVLQIIGSAPSDLELMFKTYLWRKFWLGEISTTGKSFQPVAQPASSPNSRSFFHAWQPRAKQGQINELLILVVDDEPDVEALFRQQFRRDIRDGNFTMDFAQSADSALKLISDAAGIVDPDPFRHQRAWNDRS
jgi:hypothetical protein